MPYWNTYITYMRIYIIIPRAETRIRNIDREQRAYVRGGESLVKVLLCGGALSPRVLQIHYIYHADGLNSIKSIYHADRESILY